MGVYVYAPRKRVTKVRLDDGQVVDAYPLAYFSRLSDFNRFFDSGAYGYEREIYNESWKERMKVGALLKAFNYISIEYVYVSEFDSSPVPLSGDRIYKIGSKGRLVPAHVLACDMDPDSACYDEQDLFWADCDSLGDVQGVLVRPTRVGRKLGPWTLTEETPETEALNQAECSAENAKRKAKRGMGRAVRAA